MVRAALQAKTASTASRRCRSSRRSERNAGHAAIAHLRLLVRMTRPRDWHDGMPVVWMSVKKTAELLGITPAQVNRNENRLMAMRSPRQRQPQALRHPLSGKRASAPMASICRRWEQSARDAGGDPGDALQGRISPADHVRRRIRGIFAGMNDGHGRVPRGPLTRWPASSRRSCRPPHPARCRWRNSRGCCPSGVLRAPRGRRYEALDPAEMQK